MKHVKKYLLITLLLLSNTCLPASQQPDSSDESEPIDVEGLLVNETPQKEPLPEAILDTNNELIIYNNVEHQSDESENPEEVASAEDVLAAQEQVDSMLYDQAPLETGPDIADQHTQAMPINKKKHTAPKTKLIGHNDTKSRNLDSSPWVIDEGDEPNPERLAQLNILTGKDIQFHIGGRLKDELFVYHQVHTLRSDYHDENDFVRHKLNLDLFVTQGMQKYGRPASQGCVRLTNYVFWQDESQYSPITIDEIKLANEDLTLAKDVKVKTLIPLLFVEQAWFKLNMDTFTDTFNNHPTFLKIGYFPYTIGRGVAMGYHEDLAVDYLGWGGEGGFTRYPFMPPGVLFRTNLTDTLSWDVYFNLWRETNAGLSDTLKPERWSRLTGPRPERGSGKDRITLSTKLDFTKSYKDFGDVQLEPYAIFVHAPEQTIELAADASAKLYTYGVMADFHRNNWSFNVELACQCGAQRVHALDRNEVQVTRSSATGALGASFSHVQIVDTAAGRAISNLAERAYAATGKTTAADSSNRFTPNTDFTFVVNTVQNKDLSQQGQPIVPDMVPTAPAATRLINTNVFGNARFRNPYKLSYQGFMALADLSYTWENHPFMLAGAAGYISGDNYPYNDEVNRTFTGFIPLRSRYKGLGVQNFLIFDRLVIPRPLNISHRTLYAFNDQKDLSNLQFLGLGLTWYPFKERKKMSVTTDVMWLWEATRLNKWDKNGKHWDSAIEAQLARLRNSIGQTTTNNGSPTLFSGWEGGTHASRMLGTEIDMKILYRPLDHCDFIMRGVLFFPGQLYKDLDGQPNALTRRVDELGYKRFDSLGSQVAFAFVTGLNYRF